MAGKSYPNTKAGRRQMAEDRKRREREKSYELGEGDNYWERGISHHDGDIENRYGTYRARTDKELGIGDYNTASQREQLRREDYFRKKENDVTNIAHWKRFADTYYGGDLDKAIRIFEQDDKKAQKYSFTYNWDHTNKMRNRMLTDGMEGARKFAKDYRAGQVTLENITINPGDVEGLKAKQKTLEMMEQFAGITPAPTLDRLSTTSEAAAFAEGTRRRYKQLTNKLLGEEIMTLDRGGFKKLEDFAIASKKVFKDGQLTRIGGGQPIKEGMDNLRDRMAGKTDRDTGKGARRALADIVRDRKSGIGSSAAAKSSMEKRAATAAAVNANSQAVNKYFDRLKAREELAKAAAGITSFDIKRKRDLRSTKSKFLTGMAGFEMDELGYEEIKDLTRKPLEY